MSSFKQIAEVSERLGEALLEFARLHGLRLSLLQAFDRVVRQIELEHEQGCTCGALLFDLELIDRQLGYVDTETLGLVISLGPLLRKSADLVTDLTNKRRAPR